MSIIKKNCGDFDHFLNKCTQAFEKKDFHECLYAALNCFNFAAKSEDFSNKIAAIRMIKFSSEKLIEELQPQTSNGEINLDKEKCSFCKKSGKKTKFIFGADVQICHECIETMYDSIHKI